MTENNIQPSAPKPQPVLDLSRAPMPNVKTLKSRYNLFSQFGRFVAFNLRILRMVVSSGH
jgi:hypothetical protein